MLNRRSRSVTVLTVVIRCEEENAFNRLIDIISKKLRNILVMHDTICKQRTELVGMNMALSAD